MRHRTRRSRNSVRPSKSLKSRASTNPEPLLRNDHEENHAAAVVGPGGVVHAAVAFTRPGTLLRSALAAAVPLHSSAEFHERSQWDGLLQRRISPVLPVPVSYTHLTLPTS